jgi:hypothetical protein
MILRQLQTLKERLVIFEHIGYFRDPFQMTATGSTLFLSHRSLTPHFCTASFPKESHGSTAWLAIDT